MSGTTEDTILSSIPDFQGDDSSVADSGGADSQGSSQSSGDTSTGRSSAPPPSRDSQGGGTDASSQPVRRRHDGLLEVPNPQNPATRDLVDPISGRVVAQGGIERRVYEEGQRHARENQTLRQQLQQATQQLSQTNEVVAEGTKLNIAPEHQVVAIRVMADFMRDPVRTLEYLIEEVKSKGYTIPFLTNGISPGMDLNAVSRMIDGKLQPITQEQQARREQQAQRARAEAQISAFLSDHPEANSNLDVLSEMIQARPNMTLEAAYLAMVKWARDNDLDYAQSLKRQLEADQPTTQQPTQQPTRPLPNGRSAANGVQRLDAGGQYSENSSWSDIIRQTMQESGMGPLR